MSVSTAELVRQLNDAGTSVNLNDVGGIHLSGQRPPPALIAEIRANRDAVMAYLQHCEDLKALEDRLAAGWEKCRAETNLARKNWLEDHWIDLLNQYERAWGAMPPTWLAVTS